jgi:hypothetical protein
VPWTSGWFPPKAYFAATKPITDASAVYPVEEDDTTEAAALDVCADHPYVDIETLSSTLKSSYCVLNGDTQACRVGAYGTVRFVERGTGFCNMEKRQPAPMTELPTSCSMICGWGAS